MQHAWVVVEEIDEAAVVGVFFEVRLLLGNEESEEVVALSCLLSDGCVGLDHLASEARDLQVVEEGVMKGCRSGLGKLDGNLAAEVERVQDFFDETEIVLGDDSAGVAGLVGNGGVANVEGEMEGEFAGDIAGQRAFVYERCEIGVGAVVGDWGGSSSSSPEIDVAAGLAGLTEDDGAVGAARRAAVISSRRV